MHFKPEIKRWLRHIHMPESHGLEMIKHKYIPERPFWEVLIVLAMLCILCILLASLLS